MDWAEVGVYFRAYRTLLNPVFMTRFDRVLMEKRLAEYLAFWGAIFGSVEVGTRCRDPRTWEIL